MKLIKRTLPLLACFMLMINLQGKLPDSYRFLTSEDILSNTWGATVDNRKNQTEPGIVYPFFIGDSYYKKGISIPLREKMVIKADERYNYISFLLGVDQFLFPEAKVRCRLVVKAANNVVYTSPELTENTKPIQVTVPTSGLASLSFELQEISKYVFDSPNNWADVNYLGVDMVNFIYTKDKSVAVPDSLSQKTVDENIGMKIAAIPIPSSAWAVKFIPNAGPDRAGIALAGCFDNKLYAFSPKGKLLWQAPLKGVPQHIAYCYEGNKVRIGVFSWSVNTDLSIFDENGKRLKVIENDCKLKALAAHNGNFYTIDFYNKLRKFSADGKLLSLDTLENVNGRPVLLKVVHIPEINANRILLGTTGSLICYDEQGKFLWKRAINQINLFLSATYELEPTTINGTTHFIVGSRPGSVVVLTYDGKILYRDRYVGRGHSAPEIALGNFTASKLKEIVAVSPDGAFHLFDINGHRIKRWKQALPFVDMDNMKISGKDAVLAASMGPRDHQLYFLTFHKNSADTGFDKVPAFRKDHVTPVMAEIKSDIDHLKYNKPNVKDSYVSFLYDPFGGNFTNSGAFYNEEAIPEVVGRLKELKKTTSQLSGNRVHFLPMLDLWSCVFHKERRPIQNSKLNLKVLAEFEKLNIPFALFIMHLKNVPIEDLRELVKQNKNTLKAFHFSERDGMTEYKDQVMELAKEAGIKVLFGIHRDYWLNVTQNKEEFNILFNKKYQGVLVPIVKPHPGSFDLNWMSVFGLLKTGYITEWGVASQCWNWDWGPRNIDAMYPVDLLFRHDFQAASLGANWYLPEGDFTQDKDLVPTFYEGREPFYKLLRSGVFGMASLDQNKRISPIEIKYNKAKDFDFVADNRPGHFFTTGFFEGLLMTTPPNSYSNEITAVGRYVNALFPKMPYGFTFIVPEEGELKTVKGWSTDGRVLYKDGEPTPTSTLVANLKAKSMQFPVNSTNCFLSVQKIGNDYLLYVSTLGYLYPKAENVQLTFNAKIFGTAGLQLQDILKNKTLTTTGNQLQLNLKPGEVKIFKYTGRKR